MLQLLNLYYRRVRLRNRKAFTLVELILVLVVALTIITVGLRVYSNAQMSSKITQTSEAVGQIRSAIETVYSGQSSYAAIAAGQITPSLPTSLVNAGAIVNSFGGNINLYSDTLNNAGDSYTLAVTGLPQAACLALAAIDLGKSLVAVGFADAAVADANATPVPLTSISTNCADNNNNIVAYQFH